MILMPPKIRAHPAPYGVRSHCLRGAGDIHICSYADLEDLCALERALLPVGRDCAASINTGLLILFRSFLVVEVCHGFRVAQIVGCTPKTRSASQTVVPPSRRGILGRPLPAGGKRAA